MSPDTGARLAAPSRGPFARRRPIHGDFSANQVLVSGSQVAVIDLDDARLDDPAADLGVFAAQLELRVLQGSLARERAEMLLRALLAGYGVSASSPFELRSVRMHLARELLARAPGTFRRGESGWLGRLEHILRRAEQLAEPG